ncbi:MAG: RsmB/NOP family class I SAM-dependent RNA methyltransferase, partial [Alkalispirochaeta sp.]
MAQEKGSAGFERYYSEIYGERWPALKAALLTGTARVAFEDGLVQPYYLDPASVTVAQLLPVADAQTVLDLCAAPGGKALVIAGRMDPAARMTANERSRQRRRRLISVLDTHLPSEIRERISVTGYDAAQWGVHQPDAWDAVLADVPCSSEEHVLKDTSELTRWSHSRVKRLAIQQGAILAAAV